jgi:uncharacterized repeat protein (TIGR02543 family)
LTSITIPDSVTSFESAGAFEGCTSLTSITLPKQISEIGEWMFCDCTSLTSITIPDGVTWISSYAFRGCTSLKEIHLPDGLEDIGWGILAHCTSLTSVTIPDGVSEVSGEMFYGCTSLTSVTIPDGATYIGWATFANCTSLTSISIPSSVTEIGDYAIGYASTEDGDLAQTKNVTIYGYSGSAAETYAKNNGITFVECGSISYKVKFDGNGATSGTMKSKSMTYGKKYTLAANAFTRTGYTFAGWNTAKDGSGTTYADQASVKNLTTTNGKTVTLYAQWTANTYTIKYNGNGSTSGTMSSSTKTYGKTSALKANTFTRTGYTFAGWNTAKDGSGTAYADKASVKNLTTKNGKTVTLYAQWTANTYTVKFYGNGSTSGSMKSKSMTYDTASNLTANAYKRTGYTFAGWNTKADGSGKTYKNKASVKNLTSTDGKTVKLYAQWTANTYTVKFNGNGATSGSMKNKTLTYDTAATLTANAYKRTGYTFAGWNTKADGTGKSYKNKASVQNLTSTDGKTITLYAQWKKK